MIDKMNIIVLNCGSSSIKYKHFLMPDRKVMAQGIIDKLGIAGSSIAHRKNGGEEIRKEIDISSYEEGIRFILHFLTDLSAGTLLTLEDIDAVGHRVVHGGERFSGSVLIGEDVIQVLEECTDLAPLHNPPNLQGIRSISYLLPGIPQVGVFDTAFFQNILPHVFLYGIPYHFYDDYKIRRYGFHGTSHRYVSQRACQILGVNIHDTKIITCHLGNGSSVAAIKNGRPVDTSMGLTPLEGLVMGTRCGDLDVGALLRIMEKEQMDVASTSVMLNKQSGMLGISGVSSDMRDIETAAENGNGRAALALEMFAYRVKKFIGAYTAALGGVDIIVFTGGIGENDIKTRNRIVNGLEYLGIDIDPEINNQSKGQETILTSGGSKVKVLVVPTNEELVIAEDTYEIISKGIRQIS